jgi:hypothetical protein
MGLDVIHGFFVKELKCAEVVSRSEITEIVYVVFFQKMGGKK